MNGRRNPPPRRVLVACWLALASGIALADSVRVELPNGDIYDGEIRGERRTGSGSYYWRSGDRYTGDFLDNRMEGTGTYVWADGRTYTGDFVADRREGRGVLQWPNGNRYEGTFRDGSRSGLGTFLWRDGTVYSGEFNDDRMDGFGIKQRPDGQREVQQWRAGELAAAWPLREIPQCRLTLAGRAWMFEADTCINGLAHGRGMAVSLDGSAMIDAGRFVLGRLVEGEIRPLVLADAR